MSTQHAARASHRSALPHASAEDPLARVLALEGTQHTTAFVVAVILAMLVHGTAAARTALVSLELLEWTRGVQAQIADRLAQEYDLDVQKPPEPPPPPPEEKKDEAPKAPDPPPPANAPPPPPPAAAQAGKVLTADPDPNEPVDLTGGFVSGTGTSYAGGVTQANGTSTAPVYNPNARATGTPGGTGAPQAAPAPVGPDRSRAAHLGGNGEWGDCPFPPEADTDQIDDTYVMIQVQIDVSGKPLRVDVLKDPGHGFGRQARMCGMQKAYEPALDRDGHPIPGVAKLRVHFER